MSVAKPMSKPIVKISVSDSDSNTDVSEDIQNSENEDEISLKDEKNDDESMDEEGNESMVSDEEVQPNSSSDCEANESGSSDDETTDSKDVLMTNEGWADSVAKILSTNKPKNKKTLVLSRAKKHSEIVKKEKVEKPSFEVIGENDEKPEIKPVVKEETTTEPPAKRIKHEKPSIRVKPNILEKDRERLLTKIATKGVVQLFNAVRNQQKTLEKDLDRKDLSEGKKEKILKKFDKRTFLDSLMGNTKSVIVDEATAAKNEVKDEEKPKWSALRDDFMMGAKMKDWDKESVDE